MRAERRISKRHLAAVIAAALAVAIALTGTFAWQNRSQEQRNEVLDNSNPGGRFHDDFNGLENKDVYAENFTAPEDGLPVFVRVRLEEYMETGEDAGVNRHPTAGTTRKVKPLLAGADINDTSTWHIHKPGDTSDDDPFHGYFHWTVGGQTVYMPTFNKNKDSITVDVNGTYVGTDGVFETGVPYDDYDPVNPGDSETADAYYDADANDVDEYTGAAGTVPGGGGTEKTAATPNGNYTKQSETHDAAETLKGLGVIKMSDWLAAGKPVCNKWVWDEDGWYYWPEPLQPGTATGLLLDKVQEFRAPSERCYYAINLVGQFASADDWGEPNTATGSDPSNATGFYIDGFTDNAKTLLDQAADVVVGANGKWYLPQGHNLFKEILDDEGKLGDYLCAGNDEDPGTADDRTDVLAVNADVMVNGKNYGKFFLKPTADEPYYRAVTPDDKLGYAADDRLWVLGGGAFPADAVDEVADAIEVDPDPDATTAEGRVELEVGGTTTFTAAVKLKGAAAPSQDVVWTVAASDGTPLAAGTKIDANGQLTLDAHETATLLTVTAKSKLDDRVYGSYGVKVYVPNVKFTMADGSEVPATLQAGQTLNLKALLYHSDELAATQPTDFTWEVGTSTDEGVTIRPIAGGDVTNGVLTVADDGTFATRNDVNIYVKASSASASIDGILNMTIQVPDSVEVTADGGATEVIYRTPLKMVAKVKAGGNDYAGQKVLWTATDASGANIPGVSIDDNGELSIGPDTPHGAQIVVKATAVVNQHVSGSTTITANDGKIEIDGREISVDGWPFIVMTTQGDKTLVLAAKPISSGPFALNNSDNWSNSNIRDIMNQLVNNAAYATLKAHAIPTQTYTRDAYNGTDWVTSTDLIFALSESDVFDCFNNDYDDYDQRDYTAGAAFKWKSGGNWVFNDASGTAVNWWLRSPRGNPNSIAAVAPNGNCTNNARVGGTGYVFPALWLDTPFVESLLASSTP